MALPMKIKKKSKNENLQSDLLYWGTRIAAEYIIKIYIFPYVSVSAFFDGGIQALVAFIGLHIYWFLSLVLKKTAVLQGLTRWQKWLLIGIDIGLVSIAFFIIIVVAAGFCQVPGSSLVASYCSNVPKF